MESFGIHGHGCPEPGARTAVVGGRTCALAIDGIRAATAIVEARMLCVLLRMLISSGSDGFLHASLQPS
jgi:hypothetical protein